MNFECINKGVFGSNCYILYDGDNGVVIDAGVSCDEILNAADRLGVTIKSIILTHSHYDHICSVNELREKTGAEVLVHKDDADNISNPKFNFSSYFEENYATKADKILNDGDILCVGNMKLEIIHTPGHTPGGICIKADENLFSGDTLFKMTVGRSDLPGGDGNLIINSIKNKLLKLDDDIVVYPGHGGSTTIGFERKNNSFLK